MMKEDSIYDIMERFRKAERKLSSLNEEDKNNMKQEQESETVPYTTQDEILNNSVNAAKQQFGANFEKIKTPMTYNTLDGDIIMNGEISPLRDAKFQFRYKDPTSEGCFVWVEPLQLTDENLNTLKKIYGTFKNWKHELDTIDDKKPISMKGQDTE